MLISLSSQAVYPVTIAQKEGSPFHLPMTNISPLSDLDMAFLRTLKQHLGELLKKVKRKQGHTSSETSGEVGDDSLDSATAHNEQQSVGTQAGVSVSQENAVYVPDMNDASPASAPSDLAPSSTADREDCVWEIFEVSAETEEDVDSNHLTMEICLLHAEQRKRQKEEREQECGVSVLNNPDQCSCSDEGNDEKETAAGRSVPETGAAGTEKETLENVPDEPVASGSNPTRNSDAVETLSATPSSAGLQTVAACRHAEKTVSMNPSAERQATPSSLATLSSLVALEAVSLVSSSRPQTVPRSPSAKDPVSASPSSCQDAVPSSSDEDREMERLASQLTQRVLLSHSRSRSRSRRSRTCSNSDETYTTVVSGSDAGRETESDESTVGRGVLNHFCTSLFSLSHVRAPHPHTPSFYSIHPRNSANAIFQPGPSRQGIFSARQSGNNQRCSFLSLGVQLSGSFHSVRNSEEHLQTSVLPPTFGQAEESQQTGSAVGRVIEVSPQTPSPTGSDTQNLASYGAEEFVTDITTAMTRGAWYDIL
ncbi:hypothetical protein BaRGS_00009578 [Batillaria attramentaria]|uniref:Uncharacterized protein n=1 Tax=Batillaria attramentaria TaxID=370345 RepID=A0ABD0LJI0_9CAEN